MNKIQVFISYSHKDKEIADTIQRDFLPIDSVTLIQDVRDMGYKGSIKEFMKRVRDTDFVLMLISDHFIKSPNCMYEVMELLESSDFEKRLLPIQVSSDGRHADIFSFDGRAGYIRFWEDKLHESSEKIKEHRSLDNLESLTSDLKHYRNIRSNIGQFFDVLSDWNIALFEELRHENYRSILNFIGIKEVNQAEDALRVQSMHDPEEQEIALQNLLKKNPENKGALLIKAYLAFEKQQYKVAAYYYSQLLEKDPLHEGANLNSALSHFYLDDDKKAEAFAQKTLGINPDNVSAHLCLAELHARSGDEPGAEKHFRRAVKLAPGLFEAHFNYANFLLHQKNDLKNALARYTDAARLQPEHQETLIRLADIYAKTGNHHQSYEICRQLLTLWPHHAWARQMIAHLQTVLDGFSRVEGEENTSNNSTETSVTKAPENQHNIQKKPVEIRYSPDDLVIIKSPVWGTFYHNNNVDAIYNLYGPDDIIDNSSEHPPLVQQYDQVSADSLLGIVLLGSQKHHIVSDEDGIIVTVFVKNIQQVDENQPLFTLLKNRVTAIRAQQKGYFFRGEFMSGAQIYTHYGYYGPTTYSYDYSNAVTSGPFFVDRDQWVEKGQKLCKIRFEGDTELVLSPVSGYITKIYVQDGQPIRENQPLFEISSHKPPA